MGPVSDRPLAALALALALVLAACGGGQRATTKAKPTVTFQLRPWTSSNRGRPLHALVRAVTLKQFVEDQYRNVAELVVNPDESVLSTFVVFPGVSQRITVDKPAKGGVAVYFLFTGATGTSWKQLFDSPPAQIALELGENAIVAPSSKKPATKNAKAKR